MKKFLLVLVIFIVIGAGVLWNFRFEIFQFSAETIIMKNLPPYVKIERIIFDLKNNLLEVKGFKIKNPKGYQHSDLATITDIKCHYKMRGAQILDGIEVTDITAYNPVINIEKLSDGRINVNDMGKVVEKAKPAKKPSAEKAPSAAEKAAGAAGKTLTDYLTLPSPLRVTIDSGRVVYVDKSLGGRPYMLTFDDMNGKIDLSLSSDYMSLNQIASTGKGIVNSDRSQGLKWNVRFDPTKSALTMSNRFEPDNVDIVQFKPYYDQYSPIDIESGRMSGTLIFDFDNGNIGSNNTIVLRNLKFKVREGQMGSQYWGSMVPDVIRYLSTGGNEITFDFTIKGNMNSPQFALGKRTQEVITQGFVQDTVRALIQKEEGGQTGGAQPSGGTAPQSTEEQVMNLLQGLMNK